MNPARPGALVGHDVDSLATWLAAQTGRPLAVARRAAAKAMRHAWRPAEGVPAWDDHSLQQDARIGRWARAALLQLSPRPVLQREQTVPSDDGAIRALWRLHDDELIESVLIPTTPDHRRPRNTVCVSSQVGCSRRCSFCESGRFGLRRQLSSAEIVDQVRLLRAFWASSGTGPITNVVFMGMGEPLDNLPAVARAISLLCHHCGFGIAPSHVTVSTVGIVERFAEFFATTRAELAVSLGAPDDERRRQIMPAAAHYDLETIRAALLCALPRGRRVLFQYALFAHFNDAPEDADQLADFVLPVGCRVNVLIANPGPTPRLGPPSPDRIQAFLQRLHQRGVRTILRASRGADVGGACGQLAGAHRAQTTS